MAKGAGITLVGRVAGRGMQVLGQIVLARLLGPATFGLYAVGWTILHMLSLVAPLGLDQGVIRYGSHYYRTDSGILKSVLSQSVGLSLLSGLLLGGDLYVAAPWLAEQVFGKRGLISVLRWFSLAFPLASGLRVAAAATRVSQRMPYSAYAEDLSQSAANLLLIVVFCLMGWGLFGAVAAVVGSFTIALILAVYYMRRPFPKVFSLQAQSTLTISKELLAFSLSTSLAGVFTTFIAWSDRLLVSYFLPAAETGIYQAASQLSFLFVVILNAFNV